METGTHLDHDRRHSGLSRHGRGASERNGRVKNSITTPETATDDQRYHLFQTLRPTAKGSRTPPVKLGPIR